MMYQRLYALGIPTFAVGAAAFLYSAPKMDTIRSAFGQLALAFGGQQAADQVHVWQLIYYSGIVGMTAGGVFLLAGLLQHVTQSSSRSGAGADSGFQSPHSLASTPATGVASPGRSVPAIPDGGKLAPAATAPAVPARQEAPPVPVCRRLSAANSLSLRLSSGLTVALREGVQLSARQTGGYDTASDASVAQVSAHPGDPSILGLKNLTGQTWSATLSEGEQRQVEPGRSIKVAAGTKIDFGSVLGEICG
jgi:hypothetical protein